ncbi:hypothetical protein BJF79_47270 [Actinomadura sp. CNU-125]|uniref:DUF2997 domain-containing protein n=1 Tax=Actinomadura sp. CNU-125 TaxID=1904961 RepID=UPI00095B9F1C|nr:DUF2997 domain-containing protein [Actinomadura sp. CNU-125]OLT20445.1 hypothetical protein BJF79_47270 [Actinomadura sp. CNU-125]
MDETVEVTIKPNGKVEIHVTGVDGMSCLKTTEELVEMLGGEVETQELTTEAYNETGEEQQDRLWH